MIVKAKEALQKSFHGVDFEVLAHGEKSMITKMKYVIGNKVPFHAHPNEQSGYVISGKYRIQYQDYDEILISGDSYVIPGNVEHAWEVIEEGEAIDVFTPPRTDY